MIMLPGRIPISEWPAIRDLYGLKVIKVEWGDHGVVLQVKAPAGLQLERMGADMFAPIKENYLARLMADMVNGATMDPGQVKRIQLSGGLLVEFICGLDGFYRIQISRERVAPSTKEWETTLAHLPMQVDPDQLVDKKDFYYKKTSRHYIQAGWKIKPAPDPGQDGE